MYYYAVRKGRTCGIFETWTQCRLELEGYSGAEFKKFRTHEDAIAFLNGKAEAEPAPAPEPEPITSCDSDMGMVINIYTDGACSKNGQIGAVAGIGVYFGPDDPRNISEPLDGKATNNRAELTAIYRALQVIAKAEAKTETETGSTIRIYTDSKYSMNCVRKWIHSWRERGWKLKGGGLIKNLELIKGIDSLITELEECGIVVEFQYIRAHTGATDRHSLGNAAADLLAVAGCES